MYFSGCVKVGTVASWYNPKSCVPGRPGRRVLWPSCCPGAAAGDRCLVVTLAGLSHAAELHVLKLNQRLLLWAAAHICDGSTQPHPLVVWVDLACCSSSSHPHHKRALRPRRLLLECQLSGCKLSAASCSPDTSWTPGLHARQCTYILLQST